jgi:hypothetical protein
MLRARAERLRREIAEGNPPLKQRRDLLREIRDIEEGTFRGDLPVDPIAPRRPVRPGDQFFRPDIGTPDAVTPGIDAWAQETGEELEKSLAQHIADGLRGGFDAGVTAFLSTGSIGKGLAAFGGQLLQGLGKAAIEFGVKSIAIGGFVKAIVDGFKTLNPVAMIAGGVALVALGSALTAAAGSAVSSAQGGASGGGFTERTIVFRVPTEVAAPASSSAVSTASRLDPLALVQQHNEFWSETDPVLQGRLSRTLSNGRDRGVGA